MNIYYGSDSIQDTQYLLGYLILTKKKKPTNYVHLLSPVCRKGSWDSERWVTCPRSYRQQLNRARIQNQAI